MSSYNPYNSKSNDINDNLNNTVINRGFFNKLLRNISNFGMDFSKLSAQNSYSISLYEDPATPLGSDPQNMYDIFTKKVIANILNRKSIAFLDRAYEDKRKILRQYSIKDEIKEFLTVMSDEVIIYNDDNFFCGVADLPDDIDETVRIKFMENFEKVYRSFGFDDGTTGWNYIKNLLIDGYIAYEIVYDDKQKNVEKLLPIDPISLIPATDPATQTVVWVQYPNDSERRRVLLDAQIIYISWSNNNEYSETSYIENLIRPYNQLKLIEQTRLLYNINQAAIYKKFIIPTNGLSRQQAEQQIQQLMAEYHEDVQWDDQMGTVSINGSNDVPHSKDFWFPSGEQTPDFEIVAANGTDLNEDTMLNYFYKKLKKASRIPFARFEEEGGGGSFVSDTAELTKEEVKFGNFSRRIQTIFKEILIKPLKIQMILDFPELKDDNHFHSNVKLNFNKNDLFEEWKYLNNLTKRAEIASTLTNNLQVGEGAPYIPIQWIMKHIMKFSDEQLNEMERMRLASSINGAGVAGGGGVVQAGGEGQPGMQGGEGQPGMQGQGGQGQPGIQGQGGQPQSQPGGGEEPQF
jgi:Bacteriophage T4-like portal protein (Gp20)